MVLIYCTHLSKVYSPLVCSLKALNLDDKVLLPIRCNPV